MDYDPVTLDVIWNRLISICDEAELGVQRTAYSSNVSEGRDFCCLLLDPKGDSIAQGSISLLIFTTAAPRNAKAILEKFPAEELEEGDIVISNNPWVNAGHLYDVFALEPIYHRGKLIALAGSVMHWPDIGGRGADAPDNRSIYEEGLQLPIIKIAKRGKFNEEVIEIIRENVRFPDEVVGDFQSQLIGNDLMRRKVIDLIEKQGIEDFGELSEIILSRSEAAMRNAIANIPDGDYENEIIMDGIDRELIIKVKVGVRGTEIHVDYAGSSPQVEWSINSTPNFTYPYTFTGIKAAVAPFLPNNSGQMRPVTVSMPVGSILNPRYRSVGTAARNAIGSFTTPAVFGALAKTIPEQAQAESAPYDALHVVGIGDDGRPFHVIGSGHSGMGGRHNSDGISAIGWPHIIKSTPIEVTEHSAPAILVERKHLRIDSGGPGRYRGGCGQELELRVIGQESAVCHPIVRRTAHRPHGLQGGEEGVASRLLLNGAPIHGLRTTRMKNGDRLTAMSSGGGGYGDPLERDPEKVFQDVRDELVSLEQAEAGYGVVIDATTGRLDTEATAALRLSRQRDDVSVSSTRAVWSLPRGKRESTNNNE